MTVLRAALFDLDGVLVDTDAAVARLWREVCRRHGREMSDDEVNRWVLGCAAEHTVGALFPHLTREARGQLLAEVRLADQALPVVGIGGASNFVRNLHTAGVPMALVTGASHERARTAARHLRLAACFSTVVGWGDVIRGKPSPDCYQLASRRLGLTPVECVVFEDSATGVRSAIAAGMMCVAVGPRCLELLAHGAAAAAARLEDIAVTRGDEDAVRLTMGDRVLLLRPPEDAPVGREPAVRGWWA